MAGGKIEKKKSMSDERASRLNGHWTYYGKTTTTKLIQISSISKTMYALKYNTSEAAGS